MKFRLITLFVALGVLFTFPAFAMDLHQARNAGLVGEKIDGYVAVLKETPDVIALVKDINSRRKQEYIRIAKENNQPVEVVAKLASEKIIENLAQGSYYQDSSGNWKKR